MPIVLAYRKLFRLVKIKGCYVGQKIEESNPYSFVRKQYIKRKSFMNLVTGFICTLFFLCSLKLSIYIPTLLDSATRYFPSYKNIVADSQYENETTAVILGPLGFGNHIFVISCLTMLFLGLFLFAYTDDKSNKSIWIKTIVTSFSVAGVLVTVLSIKEI
jgi:hypothetical protein